MTDPVVIGDPFRSVVRWMKVFAAATVVAGIALVGTIVITRAQLNERHDQDEKDRIERSVGSCKQQNATFIHDHNALARKDKANWNGIASLISSMSSHPDDPQTKAFIASLRAVADSYDENIIPLRTCTAAGIEKYNRELLGPG